MADATRQVAFSHTRLRTGRLGEEVALWYNVPLCQTNDPAYWVSIDLGGTAGSTCGNYTLDDAQIVTAPVLKKFFNAPNFAYKTLIMRPNRTDIWEQPAMAAVSLEGAYTTKDTLNSQVADGSGTGTRRKLLKGSFGSSSYSGPSYRSRNGAYSYWGYGTPIYRRYGRTSRTPTVTELTIVSVFSRSPIVGPRVQPSSATSPYTYTSGCDNVETGCEYTVSQPLLKDELTEAVWETGTEEEMKSGQYTMNAQVVLKYDRQFTECFDNTDVAFLPYLRPVDPSVTCLAGETPWAVEGGYPTMFVVYATDQENTEAIIGYVCIPLACLIICCGTGAALNMSWDCCPDCGGRRKYDAMDSHSGSDVASSANPMHATGGPGVEPPKVVVPMPTAAGSRFTDRDGDHRSFNTIPDRATVDVYSNDIATLSGIGRCRSLQVLLVQDNNLRSLHSIHECSSLRAIDCSNNNLKNFEGLGNVPQLEWLCAYSNDMTDLSGAGEVPSLRYLNARSNDLRNVFGIHAFVGLTHLDLANNEIENCQGLAFCTKLEMVDLQQNELSNADEILQLGTACPNLRYLHIKGNNFSAMDIQRIRDFFAARPGFELVS